MSATNMQRTLRRILHSKESLNKNDAIRLKDLVLSDGYVSRGERKVLNQAIENNQVDDDAIEVFLEILPQKYGRVESHREIA